MRAMVDNEKQWEDIEYSDYNDDEQNSYTEDSNLDYNSEYSEDNNEEDYTFYNEEYIDEDNNDSDLENLDDTDDYDEGQTKSKKTSPIIIILILVFLFLLGGVFCFIGSKMNNSGNQSSDVSAINTQNEQTEQQNTDALADSFFNEANEEGDSMMSVNFNETSGETNITTGEGENESVATVTEAAPSEKAVESDLFVSTENESDLLPENQENNAIMVVYNKSARKNPFKPPVVEAYEDPYELTNNIPFEIIEPPTSSVPDENLTRLLQTQISGILYDDESPSAIVNLNGIDQFVKVGDVVSGYKIQSITRDKVQISYKNNSYVASVGELFTKGNLEKQPAVVNLQHKFAGRYDN